MNNYVEFCLFLIFIFLLVMGGFILGIRFAEKSIRGVYLDYTEDIPLNYAQCENKTLIKTSYCLRNYVKTFYKYKIREDTQKNVSDIMINGGDCFDFSNLYIKMFRELGFNADYFQRNAIIENETIIVMAHRWAVAWDNETICNIDLLEVECYKSKQGG